MQVVITHSRQPFDAWRGMGGFGAWGAATLSLGTVASALIYPVFPLFLLWEVLAGATRSPPATLADSLPEGLGLTLAVAGTVALLLPPAIGACRRGLPGLVGLVATLPVYYALVSLAAWAALYELMTRSTHWNKTEHGLARTSRSGALRDSDGNRLPPPQVPS